MNDGSDGRSVEGVEDPNNLSELDIEVTVKMNYEKLHKPNEEEGDEKDHHNNEGMMDEIELNEGKSSMNDESKSVGDIEKGGEYDPKKDPKGQVAPGQHITHYSPSLPSYLYDPHLLMIHRDAQVFVDHMQSIFPQVISLFINQS